jgi:predicted dehydrogenase/threonine dehydrogenase-like Zn-dependent dehydrogenase
MVSMKQIFQDYRNGHLLVTDVPVPQVSANRILVKNHYSLISSGTERQMINPVYRGLIGKERFDRYSGKKDFVDTLIPLGYSCAGEVIAVGREVEGVNVGDRVACAGSAYACHAEVVSIPSTLFVNIPETVDYKSAAFVALGGISIHAIRLCGAALEETVAVAGLGLLGLLAVQVLKAAGCRVIAMDPNQFHCTLAEDVGCDFTADSADTIKSIVAGQTAQRGCDATIVFSAAPDNELMSLAAQITSSRGRVVAAGSAGLGMPRPLVNAKELGLHVSGAWDPGIYDLNYDAGAQDHPYPLSWTAQRDMKAFIDLMAHGKIDVGKLISHCFGIESAEEAYKLVTTGEKPYTGVLLSYPGRIALARRPRQAALPGDPACRPGLTAASNGAQDIGIGFIGAGKFASSILLPIMLRFENLDFRGVANVSTQSARTVAERFGFSYCTTDYRELLSDDAISSIFIATPHNSHAAIAQEAMKAGKHVFVEIPLAISEDQLSALVKTYNELRGRAESDSPATHQKILVGFNRRFSPAALQLKRWLNRSSLPMVINYRVNAEFLSAERWEHDPEVGGGRIIGEVCHFVDLFQYLTGGYPVRVFAMGMRPAGQFDCPDNVAINIEMSEGSVATISYTSCGDRAYPGERIEVFRGGLAAVIDDFMSVTCAEGGRTWTTKKRLAPDKGYDAEMEAFLGAVSYGCSDLPSFESLVVTTLAAFAVQTSLRKGTSVQIDAAGFMESAKK